MSKENENKPLKQPAVMCSKFCGGCGNTIRDDEEIFCIEIQSRVDEDDEACESFSDKEPQFR